MGLDDLTSDTPIPAVSADDLMRVWQFVARGDSPDGYVEVDLHEPDHLVGSVFVAKNCSPGADVLALFVRRALLQIVLAEFADADWHQGGEPRRDVIARMANFPLPQGVASFDPADFVRALDSPPPRS